jgi:glutamine amidotransferase
MCELLGMSANVPTDICFSFTGLMQRGGKKGPHKDGWGIAFYEGNAFREFKDPKPSSESKIAQLVKNYPVKSKTIVSHIRQANSGEVCLENTHPFSRELWGKAWVYAHNGQLKKSAIQMQKPSDHPFYQPIGATDSELAFCWMLNQIRAEYPIPPKQKDSLFKSIAKLSDQLSKLGVFNMLLSDSKYLFAFCSTKLCWITRKAPFGDATLSDDDVSINFTEHTTPNDIVTIVATEPLTTNEVWNVMLPGELAVFELGKRVF